VRQATRHATREKLRAAASKDFATSPVRPHTSPATFSVKYILSNAEASIKRPSSLPARPAYNSFTSQWPKGDVQGCFG
jgi:hypothetical protein